MVVFVFLKLPENLHNFLKLLSIFYDLIVFSAHQKYLYPFLFPLFFFFPSFSSQPGPLARPRTGPTFPSSLLFPAAQSPFSFSLFSFRPTPARQLLFFLFFSTPPTGGPHLSGSLSTPSQGRTRVRRAFPPRLGPHGPHAKAKLASAAPPFSPP